MKTVGGYLLKIKAIDGILKFSTKYCCFCNFFSGNIQRLLLRLLSVIFASNDLHLMES